MPAREAAASALRRTGLEIIEAAPWGTHFCQFYENKQDLLDLLVPYFKAGLEDNEFCLWITSEPLGAGEARVALGLVVPDLDARFRNHQIEILDYARWYTVGGSFDAGGVLQGCADKLESALARGFDGLRLTGDTFWLENREWRGYTEYEAAVHKEIGSHPVLAMCTYSLARCGALEIVDVVSNHAFALIKRAGQWQVIQSAERKRIEASLRESEARYHRLFSSMNEGCALCEMIFDERGQPCDYRYLAVNPAFERLTGFSAEYVAGKTGRELLPHLEPYWIDLFGRVALTGQPGAREDYAADLEKWYGVQAFRLDAARFAFVFSDVTDRRKAEEALRESEQRVRLKLDSILSPEGDIGKLELRDVIDAPAIQSLMDDFYRLAHIPMSILDLEGRVLVGAGWQEICTKFHLAHPATCRNCFESDKQLTAGLAPGEVRLHKCKNGMWDLATPLMMGGKHMGDLLSGQFFFDDVPLDHDLFRAQARLYAFPEDEYLAALEKVPRLSREAVSAGMSYLVKLGQMLSRLSYSNMKLARAVEQRDLLARSIEESGERLRRAQEMAHLGSWELSLTDNTLTWSDEVYRIFGLQPQEFGATYEAFLEAVHPDDRQMVDQAYSVSLHEGRDAYEVTHRVVRRGTGEVRWVHEKCEHTRDAAGRIVRSTGMVQDITERQRAEERLRHAQKLESIGLLAGGIAHDFNNLLVGVIGNASLAEEMAPLGSPVRDVLRNVIRAGEQAAHLTRQMLAYAGKGQFVLEAVDLSAVVRDTRELFQSSMSKKIALEFQLQPDLPRVECDASQMQQVFMNLVLNAGEAIGNGPGVISITTGEMVVDADFIQRELANWSIEPGRCATLEIRDTGCGMDEAVQARIFDPFFTTKFQGRGLGLAAVAGIVRAQKGAIHVTTAPGCGAAFRVLLPASARRGGEARVSGPRAKAVPGSGTVLVIDDEPIVRDLAKRFLERSGYTVLIAESGPAAIEVVRAQGGRIDLALLDASMPGMGGEEALVHLRKVKPDLKVIVSSGYSEVEALRLFGEVPISGFIQKPYTVHALASAVQSGMEPDR
jgi:PAS domain S-box-containing protein